MLRALVLLLMAGVVVAEELPFRVVVHASNPVVSMTRAELSAIYMRRTRSWPDGTEILPIQQPAASRLHEPFSRAVHGKSGAYVTRYWQRLIFSGRAVPPRELRSDAAVLDFVRRNAGAVGYVDARTPLSDGVKAIAVRP
ncbi:MAG TPA: phosphate ABC transporter substrate-binding protein [Thermoanaerobaculia bacterium]|nr:phosphate ABC transporter substrate-binding protein [Thermoanaerobaculia bacterium]